MNLYKIIYIFIVKSYVLNKYKAAPQSNEEVSMLGQVIQEPQGIILEKVAQPKIVRSSIIN
jgi:hypothetical protein